MMQTPHSAESGITQGLEPVISNCLPTSCLLKITFHVSPHLGGGLQVGLFVSGFIIKISCAFLVS